MTTAPTEENLGWITLHRKVRKNWIFDDAEKFRAWVIILMEVNHEGKKVNIGNEIIMCERGESLNSLDTWAKLFGKNWGKSKVRRFFKLLESDTMIDTKSVTKSTHLKVLQYCKYQDKRNANETQVKRKRNASETQATPNNNVNNDNNVNKGPFFSKNLEESVISFIENRKQLKKPMTSKAEGLLRKKIQKHTETLREVDIITAIETSIESGWQGVFLDKIPPRKQKYTLTSLSNFHE